MSVSQKCQRRSNVTLRGGDPLRASASLPKKNLQWKATEVSMLTVWVADDAPVRRDVDSEDMRRVHPEISSASTPDERNAHLWKCDALAYASVKKHFPALTPPSHPADTSVCAAPAASP